MRSSFENRLKGEPLPGPAITVGLLELQGTQAFLGGDGPKELVYTLQFSLYVPLQGGSGAALENLLELLLPLLIGAEAFSFTRFVCGTVQVDRTAGAYVQRIKATLTGYETGGKA